MPTNVRKQLEIYEKQKIQYDLLKQQIQEDMTEAMEKNNITNFEKENISITYKKPSTRRTLDNKKIQSEMPEIYNRYLKETSIKGSFQIKVNI